MMRLSPRSLGIALGVFFAATPALAGDREQGKRRFDEGRAHVREGRCDLAISSFRASMEAEPSVGAALNLGECFEMLGRLAEAYDAFRAAQALGAERRDERVAVARASAERVEAKLVRLALRPPAGDRDIEVKVDGVVVPPPRWGRVFVSPDRPHGITASARGCTTFSQEVAGRAGEAIDVVLAPDCDAPRPGTIVPPDEPIRADAGGATARTIGWTLVGVSGAVLLAGGVFGVLTFSARADLADAVSAQGARCPGGYPDGACDPSARPVLEPLEDTATSRATAATVLTTAGLIGAAGGLALVLLAPSRARVSSLYVAPRAQGLVMRGTW